MECIPLSQADNILQEINILKTIFWVGCGVSVNAPTCIPLGNDLTRFLLEVALGKEYGKTLVNKWGKIATYVNENVCKEFGNESIECSGLPRLEFIINCIEDVDEDLIASGLSSQRTVDGFAGMAKVPSNMNHYLLAELFLKGATVITANFDLCIENALKSVSTQLSLSADCWPRSIFHYHGTADDPIRMGSTIRRMKRGLPPESQKEIKKLLDSDYNLICVGFSCSDFFDVTPFFEDLGKVPPEQRFKGKALFFQHGSQKPNKRNKAAESMFSAFQPENSKVVFGDTTSFLIKLLKDEPGYRCKRLSSQWIGEIWKCEFLDAGILALKCYLVTILNRMGLWLTEELLCGAIADYKEDCVEVFLDSISCELLSAKAGEKTEALHRNDKNLSIINTLVEMYDNLKIDNRLSRKLKASLGLTDTIQKATEIVLKEIKAGKYKAGGFLDSLRDRESATIFGLNAAIEDATEPESEIRNMVSSLDVLAKEVLQKPYCDFMYMGYYLTIERRHWILSSIQNQDEFEKVIKAEFARHLKIAMESCMPREAVKSFRTLEKIYEAQNNCQKSQEFKRCADDLEIILGLRRLQAREGNFI